MIYSLTGTITEKNVDSIVMDVQGVGFFVAMPSTAVAYTSPDFSSVGAPVALVLDRTLTAS